MGSGNRATLACLVIMPALCGGLVPIRAGGEPLDPSDPTPRAIQVEFEVSFDPATVGQTFSEPFDATYSAADNTGTVVISAAEYEAAIQAYRLDYFEALGSLVGGSATDFALELDLTTLEATAQPFSYDLEIPEPVPQIGTVTRNLDTTATAGFTFLPEYPGFPFFCDTCVLVPGAPYDPETGQVNGVGSDDLVAPDIDLTSFSRAGDLRLSESAAPAVPALTASGLLALAAAVAALSLLLIRRRSRAEFVG